MSGTTSSGHVRVGGGESVAGRGVRGSALLFAGNLAQLATAVIATMILARLLPPADFGVAAMALLALAFAGPIRDFGLPLAIIQRPTIAPGELAALRRTNLLLSGALGLLVVLLGFVLGHYFDEARLPALVAPLGAALALRGAANVAFGMLLRRMRYGRVVLIETLATLLSAGVAVWLAARGAGAVALVAQQGLLFAFQAALLPVIGRWGDGGGGTADDAPAVTDTPAEDGTSRPPGSLLAFGRDASGTRLLVDWTAQVDRLLVGRLGDAAALGFYQNALRWCQLPLLQLLDPIKVVAIAVLAQRLRESPERYRHAAVRLLEFASTPLLGTFVFLALAGDRIVLVLLGEQWLGAISLFRLFAVATLLEGLDRMVNWLFLAEGRASDRLRFSLASVPVLGGLVVYGALLGDPWTLPLAEHAPPWLASFAQAADDAGVAFRVAVALLLARLLLLGPSCGWLVRDSRLDLLDLIVSLRRPACATLAAAAGYLALVSSGLGSRLPDTTLLCAGALLYGLLLGGVWLAIPGGREHLRWLLERLGDRGAGRLRHG